MAIEKRVEVSVIAKTKTAQAQFEQMRKVYEDFGKSGVDALEKNNVSMGSLASRIGALKRQTNSYSTEIAKLNKQAKTTDGLNEEQIKDLARLTKEYKQVNKELKDYTRLQKSANTGLTTSQVNRKERIAATKKGASTIAQFGLGFGSQTGIGTSSALALQSMSQGGLAGALGGGIGMAAGALIGGGTASLKAYAEYEEQLMKVSAITGATEKSQQQLGEAMLQTARNTRFSAVEAGQALQFLGMAGMSATDSIAAMPSVLKLAQAGFIDIGEAADIATNVMSGYGMQVESLPEIMDLMIATSNSANTSVSEFGEAMKYAAPVASTFGQDITEVSTAIGILANAGIKGSDAGVALRTSLIRLANPTKAAADALGAANIQVKDTEGNMKGLYEILEELKKANTGQLAEIVGTRQFAKVSQLIKSLGGDFDLLSAKIKASATATDNMAEKMSGTLTAKIENLSNAFGALQVAMSGGWLEEFSGDFLDFLTGITNSSSEAIDEIAKLTRQISDLEKTGVNSELVDKLKNEREGLIRKADADKAAKASSSYADISRRAKMLSPEERASMLVNEFPGVMSLIKSSSQKDNPIVDSFSGRISAISSLDPTNESERKQGVELLKAMYSELAKSNEEANDMAKMLSQNIYQGNASQFYAAKKVGQSQAAFDILKEMLEPLSKKFTKSLDLNNGETSGGGKTAKQLQEEKNMIDNYDPRLLNYGRDNMSAGLQGMSIPSMTSDYYNYALRMGLSDMFGLTQGGGGIKKVPVNPKAKNYDLELEDYQSMADATANVTSSMVSLQAAIQDTDASFASVSMAVGDFTSSLGNSLSSIGETLGGELGNSLGKIGAIGGLVGTGISIIGTIASLFNNNSNDIQQGTVVAAPTLKDERSTSYFNRAGTATSSLSGNSQQPVIRLYASGKDLVGTITKQDLKNAL